MYFKEIFRSKSEEPKIHSEDFLLINLIKAVWIILVVMWHLKGFKDTFDVFRIYFYHMPLFFFIWWYLLKDKYSIVDYIIKTIKNNILYLVLLYIFFWLINDFILFENINSVKETVFINHNFIDILTNPLVRNFHNNSFFLIAWFLLAYTWATIVTRIIVSAVNNIVRYNRFIYIIIWIIIWYIAIDYFSWIYKAEKNQALNYAIQVAVWTMYMLIWYASKNLLRKINVYWFIAVFSILYTIKERWWGSFVMSWSNYSIWTIEALLVSFSWICAIIYISNCLELWQHWSNILNKIWFHTKDIMSFHLIVFLFIDFIFYLFWTYDISKSAPFIHNETYYSWIIYISMWVYIPILLAIAYNSIIKKIYSN